MPAIPDISKQAVVKIAIYQLNEVANRLESLGWAWAPADLRQIIEDLEAERGQTW